MKRSNIKSNRQGFTIVEMLLVIMLIVLLAGIGGGIYTGTYKHMLVKTSARNFLLAAKYARIIAIERQSRCRLQVDTAGNRFWLVVDEFNEQTGTTDQLIVQDPLFKPTTFGGDVKFEKIQIRLPKSKEVLNRRSLQSVVFAPNGTAPSAVIQIGDEKNHYTVTISAATGKARIFMGTAENAKSDTVDLDDQW